MKKPSPISRRNIQSKLGGKTVEPSCYPGKKVFVNKLNIHSQSKLVKAETDFSLVRSGEYFSDPYDGGFDLLHLQYIHYFLFQDVYLWAGYLRSYDMRKGRSVFSPANKLHHYTEEVLSDLRKDSYLADLELGEFLKKLAKYYDLMNKLHPFPEGNGRTQRLFVAQLASEAGLFIDWALVHAWEIEETARQGFQGNLDPTIRMFGRVIKQPAE